MLCVKKEFKQLLACNFFPKRSSLNQQWWKKTERVFFKYSWCFNPISFALKHIWAETEGAVCVSPYDNKHRKVVLPLPPTIHPLLQPACPAPLWRQVGSQNNQEQCVCVRVCLSVCVNSGDEWLSVSHRDMNAVCCCWQTGMLIHTLLFHFPTQFFVTLLWIQACALKDTRKQQHRELRGCP